MATMEEYLREMELRSARGWTPGVPSRFTAPVSGTWNLPTTARTTMRQALPRFNLGDIAAASADPTPAPRRGRPRTTPERLQSISDRAGTGTLKSIAPMLGAISKVAGPAGIATELLRSEPAVASELAPGINPTDFRNTQAYPSMDTPYTDPTAMAYAGVTPPGEEFGSSYAGPNTMAAGMQPVGKYGPGSYMGTMGMGPPGANEVRPDYWADPVDISQLDKVETTPWGKLFEGTGLVKDWAGHDYKSGVIEQLATGDQTALTAEEADAWKGYDLSQHLTDAGKIAANIGVVPLQTLDEMKDVMTSAAANKDSFLDRLPAYISAVPSAIAAIPTGIKAGVANLNPAVPERFTAFNDLLQSGDLSTDPESIQEVISQVDTFSSPLASPDITAQAMIDADVAAGMLDVNEFSQASTLGDIYSSGVSMIDDSSMIPNNPISVLGEVLSTTPALNFETIRNLPSTVVDDVLNTLMPTAGASTDVPTTPAGPSAAEIERQKQAAINERLAQQATARQQQQAQAAQAAQDRVRQARQIMNSRDYQEGGMGNLSAAQRDIVAAAQVDTFAGMGAEGPMSAAEINVAGGMEFGGAGGMAGSDRGGGSRGGPGGRGR